MANTKREKRLRRSELAVPGSSEKMMLKAAESAADMVFLDLEDAVAPKEKIPSREKIVNALQTHDWSGKTTCVRINDLRTQWAYEDIISVVEGAGEHLDLIMIPKVLGEEDVQFVDILLSQIESKKNLNKRIGIEVLIEDVAGMMNVDAVAASSDRLEALIFGIGDYSASQGIDAKVIGGSLGYPGDIWHYGRNKITIAARVNRIDAIDGPIADFTNLEPYESECRNARTLGMVGKWCIHPAQIEPANRVFSPTPEEVERAEAIISAYDDAYAKGLGAVTYEGVMIDAATIKIVQNTIQVAALIAQKNN